MRNFVSEFNITRFSGKEYTRIKFKSKDEEYTRKVFLLPVHMVDTLKTAWPLAKKVIIRSC